MDGISSAQMVRSAVVIRQQPFSVPSPPLLYLWPVPHANKWIKAHALFLSKLWVSRQLGVIAGILVGSTISLGENSGIVGEV